MNHRALIEVRSTSPGARGAGEIRGRRAAVTPSSPVAARRRWAAAVSSTAVSSAADSTRAMLRTVAVVLPLVVLATACATVAPAPSRGRTTRTQPPPRSLPVPVAGVAPASLRDNYGAARSGGRRHEGIDIFAPKRTHVVSATEGYVSRLANGGLGGITVSVIDPSGWRHYYAHLDAWGPVREGQRVAPGTLLGYVGNTGNAASTPPHLHYGIYTDRGAINPYPLLRGGPGAPGTVIASNPRGDQPGRTTRTNPPARVPAEVEAEARRQAERLGARVLGEILRRAGGGN